VRRVISIAGESTPVTEDRSRRELTEAVRELQRSVLSGAAVISNVSLADATTTTVAHGLGRVPVFVSVSVPRGPSTSGRIEEIRTTSGTNDRRKYITLQANGYGATVTVDVLIL
jgi:hypothetical protein